MSEPALVRVGNLIRLPSTQESAEQEPIDVDSVRRARETLWKRIPMVHRANRAELTKRMQAKDGSPGPFIQHALTWEFGSPCLLMCGPTGTGKSSAAAMILMRLMSIGKESHWQEWKRIRWYGANQIVKAAREWPLGSGECPDVRYASTCSLLVLDDLGNEQEWQTTMFDLLQSRYERGLANIVTSGLRPSELFHRYGDAIMRRLAQRNGSKGTIVNCWPKEPVSV